MLVRKIERRIERILRAAKSDEQSAAATKRMLDKASWAARRHALLHYIHRYHVNIANAFWDARPSTLFVLQLTFGYAWGLRLLGELDAENEQVSPRQEHFRWMASSGSPLAARLERLHIDDSIGIFQAEVADFRQFTFAFFAAKDREAWLPYWGRSFLVDVNDDLGARLGAYLSIVFRDLWAMWDCAEIPDQAESRLRILRCLREAWEMKSLTEQRLAVSKLIDHMGGHLRGASQLLTSSQHERWERLRRRFWLPVNAPETLDAHLAALKGGGRKPANEPS